MATSIRDFRPADADQLDRVAARAFAEYEHHFDQWAQLYQEWSRMSQLSSEGQMIVALKDDVVVGGVCYIAAAAPKPRGLSWNGAWFVG